MPFSSPAFWRFLFLSFEGRISRAPYWAGSIVLILAQSLITSMVDDFADGRLVPILTLPLYYISVAVDVKRMHDRELPNWLLIPWYAPAVMLDLLTMLGLKPASADLSLPYTLISLVGIMALLWQTLELGIKPGLAGRNTHGPNPLDATR